MLKKLNQKGFSHHILVPLVVLLVVGSIGAYTLGKSNAAVLKEKETKVCGYPGAQPTLTRGSKSPCVKTAQRAFNRWKTEKRPMEKGILVDGTYGSATQAAIKKFQKANGLKVDGKVGKMTWIKLTPYIDSQERIKV
ncbi:MAG: peptidoglycan-binding domain-containing protein [Candidatus Saccharimonadales bacterium]|jgi:peptidoglycan hydrolase-like protein with peptidoglycan-binding domain